MNQRFAQRRRKRSLTRGMKPKGRRSYSNVDSAGSVKNRRSTDSTVASILDLNQAVVACTLCPRLVAYREEIGRIKRRAYRDWEYWAKPVPGFGDPDARVLIIGLAPGAHGSNRTGRPFTGDSSGNFMYPVLHE